MKELDHIGIAVSSLAEGVKRYSAEIGFVHLGTEEVPTEKVRVAMLQCGSTRIELLEPTNSDSVIASFLAKKGGGVHHLAFRVDEVVSEVDRLKGLGARFVEPAPRVGAGGCQVAFLHPKWTGGSLIELVERPSET